MAEGLTVGRREGPKDTAAKPSTTLELLAREGLVEVTRQHIKAGKVFYLDEEAVWKGFEFLYVLSGFLSLKQGEGEVLLFPGDYAHHHGLAERAYFHVREDTELLLVSSPPTFQLMRDEIDDMRSLGQSVEEKDSATEGHSQRIERLVLATAERLGLSGEQLILLSHAAYLHDIGKVGVSDDILNKPGPLTEEERGDAAAPRGRSEDPREEGLPQAGVEIVLAHHERFDGTGYPRGLRGEEIPIEARILAVADAYDAMTSQRPYGVALSKDDAREEISRHAGTQFDPTVVEAFLAAVRALDV